MPTPKRGPRLGGGPAQQKALMSNMASDLIRHGRIRTTETKAKALRPYAEKLITKAKVGDLHNRRQVLSTLRDRDVVAYLFEEVAPRFTERPGGYTRIIKLDPRPGDNARMAIIELVDRGAASGEEFIEDSKTQRSRGLFGRLRRRGGGEAAGAGAAAYTSGDEDVDADAATVDEATDVSEDEVIEATDAPADESTTPADVQDAIDEVADPDSDADSIAEATGEGAGLEAPPVERDAVKEEGSEPGDPNDPSVGVPVDETGNKPDAGQRSGKDAGEQ